LHTIGAPKPGRQPDTEGRFALVRAGVLPPLPSGCAVAAIPGHRDHPYRVSLRGGSGGGLATLRRVDTQLTARVSHTAGERQMDDG
jgi:hypothetical protein